MELHQYKHNVVWHSNFKNLVSIFELRKWVGGPED